MNNPIVNFPIKSGVKNHVYQSAAQVDFETLKEQPVATNHHYKDSPNDYKDNSKLHRPSRNKTIIDIDNINRKREAYLSKLINKRVLSPSPQKQQLLQSNDLVPSTDVKIFDSGAIRHSSV